jgi:EAL and modified HD-GYP domain-containing signal transduction protein
MMELLSGQGLIPKPPDQLFIAGLFSLLDVLMGQHLDDMLRQITLPEPVRQALAGEPGPIHDALLLAMAAESSDVEKIVAMAERCSVPLDVASAASMSALGWVQGLGGGDNESSVH